VRADSAVVITKALPSTPPEGVRVPAHDIGMPLRTPVPSAPPPEVEAEGRVRLVVWGWHNVQPGTLSWIFPSVRAALAAVRAMRNAVEWAIVNGAELLDLDAARAQGAILVASPA